MATLTNNGRAVRIVNATTGGKLRSVPVNPGQTVEADEFTMTKSLQAGVDGGQFKVSAAKAEAKKSDDK